MKEKCTIESKQQKICSFMKFFLYVYQSAASYTIIMKECKNNNNNNNNKYLKQIFVNNI